MALPSSSKPKELLELLEQEETKKGVKVKKVEVITLDDEEDDDEVVDVVRFEEVDEKEEDDLFIEIGKQPKNKNRKSSISSTAPTEQIMSCSEKVETFLIKLDNWYSNKKKTKERTMDKKELKRTAVRICSELKMDYDYLPHNWVTNFMNKFNLTFKKKEKNQRRKRTRSTPTTVGSSTVKNSKL